MFFSGNKQDAALARREEEKKELHERDERERKRREEKKKEAIKANLAPPKELSKSQWCFLSTVNSTIDMSNANY